MITLHRATSNIPEIVDSLSKRGINKEEIQNKLISLQKLDKERKDSQKESEELKSKVKIISNQIGGLYKSGKQEEANKYKAEVSELKNRIQELDNINKEVKAKIEDILLSIPNIPHKLVPAGKDEEDNEIIKDWDGPLPDLGADAIPHWELAKKYNIIDFELGAFITGSGFPLFRGKGSKLKRALINFFLDEAEKAGYEEVRPPLMVNEDSARGTGQLPDKEGQMYYVEKDNLYLIPTAEVPLTNMFRDKIVNENDFPIKVTGYTPCFRREAGSYGSDVKGLNRVHQFDKVEIVQVVHPDESYKLLDEMINHVENLLIKLELPYRIVRLCGGDLGFTSALTYDFEVYSAGQKKWLEVSSVSNFESFQANRLKLRFKNNEGKSTLAHTLNGSALALARIVAAILENNQTAEGIKIPEVLKRYLNFEIIN
ncbi:MAG TPA: serine--tRNA ligase [Bacteroidetes bacterium]|nr:serine--tRNA ligase [Bacteroidota bacterium]